MEKLKDNLLSFGPINLCRSVIEVYSLKQSNRSRRGKKIKRRLNNSEHWLSSTTLPLRIVTMLLFPTVYVRKCLLVFGGGLLIESLFRWTVEKIFAIPNAQLYVISFFWFSHPWNIFEFRFLNNLVKVHINYFYSLQIQIYSKIVK